MIPIIFKIYKLKVWEGLGKPMNALVGSPYFYKTKQKTIYYFKTILLFRLLTIYIELTFYVFGFLSVAIIFYDC